jgi:YVTN family beta-propeller protein
MIWNSQNNKIYCANWSSNNITVINGESNAVIITIPAVNSPGNMVWNAHNNKVYCVNSQSSSVTVIDGQTNSVITNITVGSTPQGLCWNSIQNRIYIANSGNNTVSVIRDSIVSGMEEEIENCKLKIENFSVYPNPAKTFFFVRGRFTVDHTTIKIFDASGKIVKEAKINNQETRISLEGIKNGIYFVQLNNEPVTKKIIITK